MRVPTARDMRYGRRLEEVVSAWDVIRKPSGQVPFSWREAVGMGGVKGSFRVGGMRRLIVNRRETHIGMVPMSESLRCVLHIFGNSGVLSPYGD
ncbi:hypothetical protein EVAR_83968_1 [Eumeta japonica]|uniref:Uncharacterized protein n=1 Tax=Eumeta variegata TaxID=151549 RepID=A0A4C1VMD5_EUMVA|nr:hypothetical protein EVAR_83968_1 [Eumeta japonica]